MQSTLLGPFFVLQNLSLESILQVLQYVIQDFPPEIIVVLLLVVVLVWEQSSNIDSFSFARFVRAG